MNALVVHFSLFSVGVAFTLVKSPGHWNFHDLDFIFTCFTFHVPRGYAVMFGNYDTLYINIIHFQKLANQFLVFHSLLRSIKMVAL